jgi:hypothetical protein
MEYNKESFKKALKECGIIRYEAHFEKVVKSYLKHEEALDDEEEPEENLECKWCGASVEHDTDFCSEKCKTNWIKE